MFPLLGWVYWVTAKNTIKQIMSASTKTITATVQDHSVLHFPEDSVAPVEVLVGLVQRVFRADDGLALYDEFLQRGGAVDLSLPGLPVCPLEDLGRGLLSLVVQELLCATPGITVSLAVALILVLTIQ